MHFCVQNEQTNLINYLLKAGADLEVVDSKGRTPLYFSLQNGNLSFIKFMVESGCDLHKVDAEGVGVVMLATRLRNSELVDYFLSKGAGAVPDNTGTSLLHFIIMTKTAGPQCWS